MSIEEQIKIADGSRFQAKLAELIAENGFKKIVETGSGVSSIFILSAFDNAGIDGKLYSIDPAMWYAHEIIHPKFEQIKGRSDEELGDLFLRTGAWDLAISDGNHDIRAQTYEYEFMFAALKPGGYLIADDTSWNNHGAWQKFLQNHGLKETMFGDARIIQKPHFIPIYADERVNKECLEVAENEEKMFLEKGGKNSSFEWIKQK